MARAVFSSSTLLTEITQRPMDPGYAAAAQRRAEGPRRPPTRRHRTWRQAAKSVIVVAVVLGLGTGAGVAQLRSRPLGAQDRAVLESEVERRTGLADDLADGNALLRLEIDAEQAAVIGEDSVGLLAATERLGLLTGALAVSGEGIVVVLDDAPVDEVGGGEDIVDDGRVRDADVQTVVNGLWGAGAEAIAINDQRLTSLSTIRHAGDAIVVDLRQLARPYTIEAIGNPETMLAEARAGVAGRYTAFLRDSYGIDVSVERADEVDLPPASRLTLRHARGLTQEPVEQQGEGEQS